MEPAGHSKVSSRRQEPLALATPEDWTEDPYFLFILLALAQRQQRKSPESRLQSRISRLLVTNVLDQESILLCEAEIVTDLLDALGNLKTAVMPLTWATIHRKMIPYKPFDSFVGRLMGELVAPSPSDSTSSDTSRRHGRSSGDEDSGPRKIRRISGS